ncbi:unnamed protein product [Victoria cruziana]
MLVADGKLHIWTRKGRKHGFVPELQDFDKYQVGLSLPVRVLLENLKQSVELSTESIRRLLSMVLLSISTKKLQANANFHLKLLNFALKLTTGYSRAQAPLNRVRYRSSISLI